MSDSDQDAPKIIVDTDWKEQVAKDKEAADIAEADKDGSNDAMEPQPEPNTDELPPVPPASFDVLVSMLFTQAMAMLGQMPDPGSGETRINKPYAKHYIDTLDMLNEKTQGNLSEDEGKLLSEALHALRMAYVNTQA